MIPITGRTREDAWLKAIKYFLKSGDDIEYNLIMEIEEPVATDARSKAIGKELDKLLKHANLYSINTVAETIFPAAEYKSHGVKGVMDIYPDEVYPEIRCQPGNARGTYAYRIVRGFDAKGKSSSPLECVMNRIKSQLKRGDGIRCAYELSIDDVQTITINRNDNSVMGFPCLSHLSFKLDRDRKKINLTALYRSQEYIKKALGNLRGLARLQSFVARELGLGVGTLVCHSTYAKLDKPTGIGKNKIELLIKSIEESYDAS